MLYIIPDRRNRKPEVKLAEDRLEYEQGEAQLYSPSTAESSTEKRLRISMGTAAMAD
ncbi:hypothetical protein DPMN_190542 [Dreissena polymorpha]|uniref:Uncharacterized protein n=1 Tax=Dreissena polymorpha TaxID=45954 RepID=A0A9D4IDF3_DREPO|nr:hypothetical protein DPMN_190542 [Dreissena polymorpha]